jgi:hypothetical protein
VDYPGSSQLTEPLACLLACQQQLFYIAPRPPGSKTKGKESSQACLVPVSAMRRGGYQARAQLRPFSVLNNCKAPYLKTKIVDNKRTTGGIFKFPSVFSASQNRIADAFKPL